MSDNNSPAPVFGPIPKFNGLEPFQPNDLPGNFKKLMDSALLGRENQVMVCIKSFTINDDKTVVAKGKCKSALFVAYLTWVSSRNVWDYQIGDPVEVTDHGRELTELFFGEAILADPKTHPVPAALLRPGAIISIQWKQADVADNEEKKQ